MGASGSLVDRVDHFVERLLPETPVFSQKSKYIHDPLWGTVEIKSYEQSIIDTPLIQRLRQIHQTGFVFATYPSATHTRFEHTVGVMHIAGRIAGTLIEKYSRIADEETVQRVRLAAIMHDSGHSAFSHTSEEIYQYCDDIQSLTKQRGFYEDKGAGEVLSYLITTSKPFRSFFDRVKRQYGNELKVEIDDFAPLILGKSKDNQRRFEAEIISGPFDADKLDYFPRDGRATGIELSFDIERLLHCLEIQDVTQDGKTSKSLVVNRGGYNAMQQLLFARATLFSTVYHHQKVRACDCMVKAFVECQRQKRCSCKSKCNPISDSTFQNASDFLELTDYAFFNQASCHQPGCPSFDLTDGLLRGCDIITLTFCLP